MAAAQKGLMTPPGLAFVAANARAHAAHKTANMKTFYWDWGFRQGREHYQKYCGTPPEHLLFALRAALDMIFEEGLEQVWSRHAFLAAATHAAVARWSEGQALTFNITEPSARSASVTNVLTPGRDPAALLAYTRDTWDVTVGVGIGELSGKAFRIAHMGHANAASVLATLSAIEMGLAALAIPHGAGGVQAAMAELTRAPAPASA
jgi:alanine-glyoxylate transaminase/serine-glyoxylate transaminase/serine-pyruvate transaminase